MAAAFYAFREKIVLRGGGELWIVREDRKKSVLVTVNEIYGKLRTRTVVELSQTEAILLARALSAGYEQKIRLEDGHGVWVLPSGTDMIFCIVAAHGALSKQLLIEIAPPTAQAVARVLAGVFDGAFRPPPEEEDTDPDEDTLPERPIQESSGGDES